MKEFIEKQDKETQALVYKAPALITLFVASSIENGKLSPVEEKSAKKYIYILSYESDEALADYFQHVEKTFEDDILELDKILPKNTAERKERIEEMLDPVRTFIDQLPESIGVVFRDDLLGFIKHTRNVRHDTLEAIVLPIISDELKKYEETRLRRLLTNKAVN